MLERIQETAAYLKGKMHTHPETAIILGTGLGRDVLKPKRNRFGNGNGSIQPVNVVDAALHFFLILPSTIIRKATEQS